MDPARVESACQAGSNRAERRAETALPDPRLASRRLFCARLPRGRTAGMAASGPPKAARL